VGLVANWVAVSPTTYTVTFDSNGGTAVDPQTQTVDENGTATEPAAPTKTGYTFAGWFAPDATTAFDFSTPITADVTLTAQWTPVVVPTPAPATTYTVTVKDNLNGTTNTYTVNSGDPFTPPVIPAATASWLPDGWIYASGVTFSTTAPITSDVTIYVEWVPVSGTAATTVAGATGYTGGNWALPSGNSTASTGTTAASTDTTAAASTVSGTTTGSVSAVPYVVDVPTAYANQLYRIGLFVGTDATANPPVYDLNDPLTRIQALILVIRLMGDENAALAYTGADPFTDVVATASYGDRYAAYGYSIGIGLGVNADHTLFDPNAPVTCQEFTAFLLRVLGYTEANGDFQYADALQKATSVNLYSSALEQTLSGGQYLRAQAVISMANALLTDVKGSTGVRLIDTLAGKGIFSASAVKTFSEAIASFGSYNG
jgi:uncharacterized repeat protein (TIGR02543 family)